MRRRPDPLDPELVAVARERLTRALGQPLGSGRLDAERAAPPPAPRRARTAARAEETRAEQTRAESELEVDPTLGAGRRLGPVWGFEGRSALAPGDSAPVGLEDLAPPRRFTRWHLGVVVGVVLLGLLWGGWSLLRARPVAIATPAPVPTLPSGRPSPASSPSLGPSSTPTPARIVVHVLGAVSEPGLVTLPQGARVQDAIDAAGGLIRSADPGELNLAQPLADGEQILIGKKGHPTGEVRGAGGGTDAGPAARGGPNAAGSGPSSPVDLNRATPTQLEELPGIGPVTAAKIVGWRDQHGRFNRPEELQDVDGIGPKTYAQIAPHVRV